MSCRDLQILYGKKLNENIFNLIHVTLVNFVEKAIYTLVN